MSDWHVLIFFLLDGLEMPLSASFLVTNGMPWLPRRHSFPRVSEPWEDSHPWSTVSWPGGPCGSGWSISANLGASSSQSHYTPAVRRSQKALKPRSRWALSRRPSSTLFTSSSLESKSGSEAQRRSQEQAVAGATDEQAGSRPLTLLPTTSISVFSCLTFQWKLFTCWDGLRKCSQKGKNFCLQIWSDRERAEREEASKEKRQVWDQTRCSKPQAMPRPTFLLQI